MTTPTTHTPTTALRVAIAEAKGYRWVTSREHADFGCWLWPSGKSLHPDLVHCERTAEIGALAFRHCPDWPNDIGAALTLLDEVPTFALTKMTIGTKFSAYLATPDEKRAMVESESLTVAICLAWYEFTTGTPFAPEPEGEER